MYGFPNFFFTLFLILYNKSIKIERSFIMVIQEIVEHDMEQDYGIEFNNLVCGAGC
jgi:hypothetical protein